MFKNYLRAALRNVAKQKGYSLIHIAGFSIGIACVIFILLWVRNELSYDRFHDNADNIYRVLLGTGSPTFTPLAQAVKDEIPEAANATRYRPIGPRLVKYGNTASNKNRVCVVDPSFFDMFRFPFVEGSPRTALSGPASIVITENMAGKLFGDEDPMGKTIQVEDRFDFQVSGVLEDIPSNSHMQFDVLAPFSFIHDLWGENLNSWGGASHLTYVELRPEVHPEVVSRKITSVVTAHTGNQDVEMNLYPLKKLHLAEFPMWLDSEQGSMKYVLLFSAVAVFLLIIAGINFLNLTTARSPVRAREVGVRKAVGATQKNLISQFLFESLFLSTVSLVLALAVVIILMPFVNNILGKDMGIGLLLAKEVLLGLIGIAFLTGLLSGSYPAFLISSFMPAKVLKSAVASGGSKRHPFRIALIVTQFSLTIILLVSASVVGRQLRFIRSHDLGFQRENIISMTATGSLLRRISAAGTELVGNPDIVSITLSSTLPGRNETTSSAVSWEGKDPDELIRFEAIWADLGFAETFDLEFVQGEYFSRERMSELRTGIIVNEAAVRAMGLTPESAIGKQLMNVPISSSREERNPTIIGVVKDFHSRSLHYDIRPLIVKFAIYSQDNLSLRIRAGKTRETLDFLGGLWAKYSPDYPLDYRFFDDILDDFYRAESRMGKLFNLFSLIAILTSCLGLFGLAANMAERRTKEIGIRKTFGASEARIVALLAKESVYLLIGANLIAWPVAYYFMIKWLQNFAFRTELGWIAFVAAGTAVFAIALSGVLYQSVKASRANPVDSIRYE